jgi:pSer/pThr/pTyr-binding forkhead associated (FHA) protein
MNPSASAAATPAPSAVAPAANLGKCPTCSTQREDSSRFCGICGHDFQTGQAGVVPDDLQPVAASPAPAASSSTTSSGSTSGSRIDLAVGVDVRKKGAPQGMPERRFNLEEAEIKIGRARAGEKFDGLGITGDNAVSGKHGVILRQADGSYILRDVGSTNGTKMGGKELTAHVDYPLSEGASFEIGEWTVVKVVAIKTA